MAPKLGKRFKGIAQGNGQGGPPASDPLGQDKFKLLRVRLDEIEPDPNQPRLDVGDVLELMASIKEHGILHPIVVSPLPGDRYRIIAGHRRYTAALRLGLRHADILCRTMKEQDRVAAQLIENMHRADLSALEMKKGYERLQNEFNLTHAQIAQKVGKSRSHVTEVLGMARIPDAILEICRSSDISAEKLKQIAKQPTPAKMRQVAQAIQKGTPFKALRDKARKGQARPRTSPGTLPKKAYGPLRGWAIIAQATEAKAGKAGRVAALRSALAAEVK